MTLYCTLPRALLLKWIQKSPYFSLCLDFFLDIYCSALWLLKSTQCAIYTKIFKLLHMFWKFFPILQLLTPKSIFILMHYWCGCSFISEFKWVALKKSSFWWRSMYCHSLKGKMSSGTQWNSSPKATLSMQISTLMHWDVRGRTSNVCHPVLAHSRLKGQ